MNICVPWQGEKKKKTHVFTFSLSGIPKLPLDSNRQRKEMFFPALWKAPSGPGEKPLGSAESVYMAAPNSSTAYTWFLCF